MGFVYSSFNHLIKIKVATLNMFLILLLTNLTDAKHHHSNLRKAVSVSKDNFFSNVNAAIYSLLNNLFESVNLPASFSNKTNTKLLLTMHYDLSNIVDKNSDTLKEIKDIIKVNVDNQTEHTIKLDSIIDEIFHKTHPDKYETVLGKRKHKHRNHKTKSKRNNKQFHINIISNYTDSKEFTDFVLTFLAKVNNLTINDFKRSSKLSRRPVPLRRNLKTWEPSISTLSQSSNGTNTRRIFKGRETSVKSFPFVVSIHVMGKFSCAGSIISRGLIITAASCLQIAHQNDFFKTNLKSIYIRMGSDYTMQGGQTIPAQHLYFHPEYEPKHLKNNLAIIRLEKRIKFTRHQKRIRRISWNDSPGDFPEDVKKVVILGWGVKKSYQVVKYNKALSVDTLEVYNFNRCMKVYTEDYLTKDNFCIGSETRHGGACNGDVGGPGVVNATLMGVISFGTPECGKAPTVITKLGNYSQWIKSIMEKENKDEDIISVSNQTQSARRSFKEFRKNLISSLMEKRKKKQFGAQYYEYPEEWNRLKDMLVEFLDTDSTIENEFMYTRDIYEDLGSIALSNKNDEDTSFFNKYYLTFPDIQEHSKTHVTMPETMNPTNKTTPRTPINNAVTASTFVIDSITPVNSNILRNILKNPFKETEENEEYTDNYETSTEEERGMSIEATTVKQKIPNKKEYSTVKVKKATPLRNRIESRIPSTIYEGENSNETSKSSDDKTECSQNTSNEEITEDSDSEKSRDEESKSIQNNKKINKRNKYSKETDTESSETKSKSNEITTELVPSRTSADWQTLNIVIGVKGKGKKAKIVHMRNDIHSKKKQPTSVLKKKKILATQP